MLNPTVNHSVFKISKFLCMMHCNVAYNNVLLYPEDCRYTGSNVKVHRRSVSQFWNRYHTFYVYTHRIGTTAHTIEGKWLTMPALHNSWAGTVKHALKVITF